MAWHSSLSFPLSPSVVLSICWLSLAPPPSLVSWLSRALAQGGRVPSVLLLLPLRSDLRLDTRRATDGKESLRDFLECGSTHARKRRRGEGEKKKKKKEGKKEKEWADLLVFQLLGAAHRE